MEAGPQSPQQILHSAQGILLAEGIFQPPTYLLRRPEATGVDFLQKLFNLFGRQFALPPAVTQLTEFVDAALPIPFDPLPHHAVRSSKQLGHLLLRASIVQPKQRTQTPNDAMVAPLLPTPFDVLAFSLA